MYSVLTLRSASSSSAAAAAAAAGCSGTAPTQMLKRSLVGRLPRIQPRPSSRRAPLLQARNPFRRTTDEPQRRRRAAALSSLSPSTVCGRNGDATSFPAVGDTIYALSTAHGRGGIAVIRISGPSCLQVHDTHPTLAQLCPRLFSSTVCSEDGCPVQRSCSEDDVPLKRKRAATPRLTLGT